MSNHDHEAPRSFDDRAATWDDDPEKRANARDVAAAIRERVPLTTDMRVLEYGAGTGLLTEALRDAIGHVVLTDVSDGMLDVMRRKVADGVIPDADVRRLDLLEDDAPAGQFDLVTTMLALHHIPDVAKALAGMHECLAPGGYLALADLDAEDGSFHGHDRHDVHRGFDRETLAAHLREAGFVDVDVRDAAKLRKDGGLFTVLLAAGRRE